jgi:hypothetical protein
MAEGRTGAGSRPTGVMRQLAVAAAAAGIVIALPAIAQAAFSSSTSATLGVSTATVPASTATVTSVTCKGRNLEVQIGAWNLPAGFTGNVTVTSQDKQTLFTGTSPATDFTFAAGNNSGDWAWTVRNARVISASNTWFGTGPSGTVHC